MMAFQVFMLFEHSPKRLKANERENTLARARGVVVALEPSKLSARVRIPAVATHLLKRFSAKSFQKLHQKGSGKLAKKGKQKVKEIALERIYRLFELAEKEAKKGNYELATRYVSLARKIGTRNRATVPADLKPKFCKKCNSTKVGSRKDAPFLIVKCKECGFERKLTLGQKQ